MCTHYLCFEQKLEEKNQNFTVKFQFFTTEKILCILYGHVFVMIFVFYNCKDNCIFQERVCLIIATLTNTFTGSLEATWVIWATM